MPSVFPVTLDAFTDAVAGQPLNSPNHMTQHEVHNDAIEKMQAKIGVDASAVLSSLDYIAKTGWIPAVGTWTYASATTITIPAGGALLYQKGDKIRLKQVAGTYKYYIVTIVADTLLTVTGGSDYTILNEAITVPAFSRAELPLLWPAYFNYTPTGPTNTTLTGRFTVRGKQCFVTIKGAVTGAVVWTNMPTLPITASASSLAAALAYATAGDGAYSDNGVFSLDTIFPVVEASATLVKLYIPAGTLVNATSPITWASPDAWWIKFDYEI